MTGVRCTFWELGAIVRHARKRHAAGLVRGAQGRGRFALPSFLTSRDSGLEQPADPVAVLAEAEASARHKGWIGDDEQLNDQWEEIVTSLVHGSSCGFLQIGDPEADEVRVLVAQHGLAHRVVLEREDVTVDELRPEAAWQSLAACLPERAPAEGRAVSVSTEVLAVAGAEGEKHRGDQGEWMSYELRRQDVPAADAQAVGALTNMADRTTAQIAVAVRDENNSLHIGPFAINVHHAPSGWVAMFRQPPNGETTTVTPADTALIATTTQRYVDRLHERVARN
ncbi:ESX secretion-associated protein EspG [Haloactinomyces albus]|uniref:EspG family protein n=1 Tax=Haloactinomyces albus TaxID=1352928 RepID=A0AAE3ZH64_9ACTN|nr:ESX secretion-associated protein EspG [Haloactinomyces albus]MDR7302849.1 hypothetical protein [Haloactinomyces albus]